MEKKYRLLDKTRTYQGHTLHRIQALKDFGDVKAGEIGGWVESERNLSQEGLCWVYDDAVVSRYAKVSELAVLKDFSVVLGHSVIIGNAVIKSNAWIYDAIVDGKAVIGKNGYITDIACYFTIDNIGSRHDTTTFYLDEACNIWVNTGCFNDTLEAFEKAVVETHGDNNFARQYMVAIKLAKIMLKYQMS